MNNPYEVLGVDKTADADEIKSAYRRLALKYHPDRNAGDKTAEEKFKQISEAYATLRDPESRARFDRYGSSRPEYSQPDFNTVDWQTIFREADIKVNWDAGSGSMPRTGNAMFDVLFGAVTGMMRNSGLLPGETRELTLRIPVAQAKTGATHRVHVPGPSVCAHCSGTGVVDGMTCDVCAGRRVLRGGSYVEVNVPKNMRNGVKLRLKGLGGPGNPPGDALVTVQVKLPQGARLDGNTIHIDLPLTPLEAARGKTLEMLGATIEVPAGTKDGDTLTVVGGGLAGDNLIAHVSLNVWQGLWRGVKGSLQNLTEVT